MTKTKTNAKAITYQTNQQLWRMEDTLASAGYTKTADCYWTQLFSRGEDELALIREESSTNDPRQDLADHLELASPMPVITATRRWSDHSVQSACIKNNLYTRGTYEQYDAMLKSADVLQPTVENLYRLAKDIWRHSRDQTITNIMYILEREAVYTTFALDGRDDV